MKIKHLYFLLLLLSAVFFACNNDSRIENEIAKIEVDFTVERFDLALAETNEANLPKIKSVYPFLFPEEVPDSTWLNRINSDLQNQMFDEANAVFGNFKNQKEALKQLFQHLKYYDKTFKLPRVITVADYVDYRTKLVVNDGLLIVNMINYLGENHEFYQNTPVYFAENMKPSQIISEIAEKYADKYAFQSQRKTFLDEMIYFGKLMYFKDVMMPDYSDAIKIGYTEQDLKWANENEAMIWSHFVEKEMLFSTDPKLFARFTVTAPFSKFYLELDNESPGAIGKYIGWQIVRAYAKRSEKDILSLMHTDADEIFKISKYKPKR